MDKFPKYLIYIILDLVLKHRWLILIPFCVAMVAGIVAAVITPKTYEAETLILVESKKVPDQYVKSVISTDITRRINTISEQIKSRTYLEKIIAQYDLFSDPEAKDMFLEDKLEAMRKSISVRVTRSGSSMDSFKIAFKGSDPVKVMNIANSLASYFIDQSIEVMEEEAIGTSAFLEGELSEMRKELEKQENALKEYREQYMGELPSDLNSVLRSLDRLQVNLGDKQEELRDAKNRLVELERQREAARQMAQNMSSMLDMDDLDLFEEEAETETESDLGAQLEKMKAGYANLLLRYTEKHPDVVKLRTAIERLEKKIAEEKAASASAEDAEEMAIEPEPEPKPESEPEGGFFPTPQFSPQDDAIESTKKDIARYEQDIEKLRNQMSIFEKRVENIPKREVELLSLTRNYENIKSAYESLLNRKLEAEIAVSMERKAKGERFRILDSAKKPEKPISPNMKMLFAMFTAGGLGIGGGFIVIFYFLSTSVRAPEHIKPLIKENAILMTIPKIRHRKDNVIKWTNLAMTLLFCGLAAVLFMGFGALCFKGVDSTVNFLSQYIDINAYISMLSELK